MRNLLSFIFIYMLGFSLVGCDSKLENAGEDVGEAINDVGNDIEDACEEATDKNC